MWGRTGRGVGAGQAAKRKTTACDRGPGAFGVACRLQAVAGSGTFNIRCLSPEA